MQGLEGAIYTHVRIINRKGVDGMTIIASVIHGDRIVQVSDSRVMSGSVDPLTWDGELEFGGDGARKLFPLGKNVGVAYCGPQSVLRWVKP